MPMLLFVDRVARVVGPFVRLVYGHGTRDAPCTFDYRPRTILRLGFATGIKCAHFLLYDWIQFGVCIIV